MKKLIKIKTAIILFGLLTIVSCSKSDVAEEIANQVTEDGTLVCKVNNDSWKTEIVTVENVDLSNNQVGTQIFATNFSTLATMQLLFTETGTGTFEMNHTDIKPVFGTYTTSSPFEGWTSTLTAEKGTITITENTATSISGSFDFYVKKSYNSESLHLVGGFNKIQK